MTTYLAGWRYEIPLGSRQAGLEKAKGRPTDNREGDPRVSTLGNFTGRIADPWLKVYKPHQYGEVTPPFTILRQLAAETPPNFTDWFQTIDKGGRR